jgi:dihydrodipicolinate synthase/N-acetylneuraminate lyase
MAAFDIGRHLRRGQVLPAVPLALQPNRKWDERRQRALLRYYIDAGAGGIAVGVHATQFEIRDPAIGLYEPILTLAAHVAANAGRPFALIAGVCGRTAQARREALLARRLGYHAQLLSLGAFAQDSERVILRHCRTLARELPLIGFYLQPAVGGRVFSAAFWGEFAEIPEVVGVKIAPFNRYQTLDVVRAVLEAGRDDIALYTGNDDNIFADLLTPFRFGGRTRWIDGGLLGQWGVWTERAVACFEQLRAARDAGRGLETWLQRGTELTDANAAIFDPAHRFAGCLSGINEILRRQGLLSTARCLDARERLSPGQSAEISRVARAYPWLADDDFVRKNIDRWLN